MVYFDYFIITTCLSVCGETTIYSTAIGDVLLERKFIHLLYGILHVLIGGANRERLLWSQNGNATH